MQDSQKHIQNLKNRSEAHYVFACQAAIPLAVTTDLLYQLWNNFKQYTLVHEDHQKIYKIHHLVISDLLMSGLFREVGFELFEMHKATRDELLKDLRQLLGERRKLTLAKFLEDYATYEYTFSARKTLKHLHHLTALSISNPAEMEKTIIQSLQQAKSSSEVMNNLLLHHNLTPPEFKSELKLISQNLAEAVHDPSPILIEERDESLPGVFRLPLRHLPEGISKRIKVLEKTTDFEEYKNQLEDDLGELNINTKKSTNGTISNIYEKNYKKYIDIGIKKKVKEFLLENKSSVCATLWGHGGVGKTATIQSLCEDLSNDTKKYFDYIIFLSAEDIRYDYYTGQIEKVTGGISTYEDLIRSINKILFNQNTIDTQHIYEFEGKVFIVIDDFQTFSKEEKDRVEEFILKLNILHHKIVVTTRFANINITPVFEINELVEEETKKFLLEVIKNEEFGNETMIRKKLENSDISKRVYEITSGRPLFIFQFAFVLGQKGSNDALSFKIKEDDTAINFLFGRVYDYLSQKAKDVFVVLSLLVSQDDLTNIVEKAAYILNLEHEKDIFTSALNELIKLKIIKIDNERRFFEIYSKEIYQIMNEYFDKRESNFKGHCKSRLNQVNRDKNLDVEHSLLLAANANRLAKNEIEVIDNYKQILNRATSPLDVKLSAILNLSAYLVDRGKRDEALKYMNDYSHFFNRNTPKEKNITLNLQKCGQYIIGLIQRRN